MLILWIIIILLALLPAVVIWLPLFKKLRVKICLTVLSVLIWLLMMSACVQLSDANDLNDSIMSRNANYVACVDASVTTDEFSTCVIDNLKDLNSIYLD